jgi:hypothetical protein
MPLMQRKTPEQRAEEVRIREQRHQEAEAQKRSEQIEKERKTFFNTPAGRARIAYDRGDHVFQYSIDVMSQQAIVVSMAAARPPRRRRTRWMC